MTFLPSFALLLAICLSAAAGVAPVLMNPFTTNTTAAADAHVVALVSGPTNGVSSAVVTNIVNGMVQSNQFTKLASGTALDGLVFTNLNATNIIGKIKVHAP